MSDTLQLGKVIEPGREVGRDAIHVAVYPMLAVREMRPGERLQNGIVDPFLKESVLPGQRFWMLLFPNTVASLRHVWSHPNFPEEQ